MVSAKGCMRAATIEHEFLHAIGLYHTQVKFSENKHKKWNLMRIMKRPKFVPRAGLTEIAMWKSSCQIYQRKSNPTSRSTPLKLSTISTCPMTLRCTITIIHCRNAQRAICTITWLNINIQSIMHYSSKAFGSGKITIKTLDPTKQDVIGQRIGVWI